MSKYFIQSTDEVLDRKIQEKIQSKQDVSFCPNKFTASSLKDGSITKSLRQSEQALRPFRNVYRPELHVTQCGTVNFGLLLPFAHGSQITQEPVRKKVPTSQGYMSITFSSQPRRGYVSSTSVPLTMSVASSILS